MTNRTIFSVAGTNARHLTYFLKNSSKVVCGIPGWSRNLTCRKMQREHSLHSHSVQKETLQLDEQQAFNALHKNLSAEIYQLQLTAPKCILTNTMLKWDLIEFCTASAPFALRGSKPAHYSDDEKLFWQLVKLFWQKLYSSLK